MIEERIVIWGRQPVLEALRAGAVESVLIARVGKVAPPLLEIRDRAVSRGVPVRDVDSGEIERLAQDQASQGVAAWARVPIHSGARALVRDIPTTSTPLILALDQIQDPHNFGALLRSGEAAGVHGVVFSARHSAAVTGTVAKTSAGALHHVRLARVANLAAAMAEMSEEGLWLMGLDEDADVTVYDADLRVPLCLVVGGEGAGLRRLTRERCDLVLRLPMHGSVSSLNASVAGGIALFEAVRQRSLTTPTSRA